MPRKVTKCTTADPVTDKNKNPAPTCPGTVLPYEYPKVINGVLYQRYEQCQRCGQIYPG